MPEDDDTFATAAVELYGSLENPGVNIEVKAIFKFSFAHSVEPQYRDSFEGIVAQIFMRLVSNEAAKEILQAVGQFEKNDGYVN